MKKTLSLLVALVLLLGLVGTAVAEEFTYPMDGTVEISINYGGENGDNTATTAEEAFMHTKEDYMRNGSSSPDTWIHFHVVCRTSFRFRAMGSIASRNKKRYSICKRYVISTIRTVFPSNHENNLSSFLSPHRAYRSVHGVSSTSRLNGYAVENAKNPPPELWRVYLHPSQRRMVRKEYKGPAGIPGGAVTFSDLRNRTLKARCHQIKHDG